MDVHFVLNGVTFVWNEEKARVNPINHDGVTFQQGVEAFFDPFLVVVDASRNDEARDAVIGLNRCWNLLYAHSAGFCQGYRSISALHLV